MRSDKIGMLGAVGYSRSIEPLKRIRTFDGEIVGFDTEYTSKGARLISYQLATKYGAKFYPVAPREKLTPRRLYQSCIELCNYMPTEILFVTYFSLAELQFLPLVSEGIDIREYANGSLDVTFLVDGVSLQVFDLARWYNPPVKLAKAAEAVGLKKLEYDTKHVTRRCLRDPAFRKYAVHDAVIQREILLRIRESFLEVARVDLLIQKTAASAAQATFRRLHVKRKIWCDNNGARRAALYGTWGGRAEVFKRGKLKGLYHEYDFAAAYPNSAIRLGVLPVQGSWLVVKTAREMTRCISGFAHVQFEFPDKESYPCIPVEAPHAMLWPLQGRAWATFTEIEFARERGAKIKLLEAWGYRKGTRILSDFMQWVLERRAESTGATKLMYKLMANSLVGKFAQAISKISINEYMRVADEIGAYLDEMLELPRDALEALGVRPYAAVGPVFMPEWNGLITGYTRAALARCLCESGAVYCHTDSLWTLGRPSSDMLPLDLKQSGPATVIRTRFAALGEPLTPTGFKADKIHVAYHSVWNRTAALQMLKKFDGVDFVRKYPIRRPLKFRESVKSGRTPGVWVEEWRCANTLWDGKRRLLKSGSTRPWVDLAEYLAWKKDVDKPARKRV